MTETQSMPRRFQSSISSRRVYLSSGKHVEISASSAPKKAVTIFMLPVLVNGANASYEKTHKIRTIGSRRCNTGVAARQAARIDEVDPT